MIAAAATGRNHVDRPIGRGSPEPGASDHRAAGQANGMGETA